MYALAQIPVVLIGSGRRPSLDIRATLRRFRQSLQCACRGLPHRPLSQLLRADSDYPLTARVDDPPTSPPVMSAQKNLGIDSAVLVANPVPSTSN